MRRTLRSSLIAGIFLLLAPLAPGNAAAPASEFVYIGTQDQAILSARLDTNTGAISGIAPAAVIERPTWLTVDPSGPYLYSVSETGNDGKSQGGVYSFAINRRTGGLTQVGKTVSGGGGATFLSYDPRVRTIFVANFGGGQVASIAVAPDGSLSAPASTQTDTGAGASAKQNMPHAHAATLDPGGHFVLTPDMGADRLFIRRFDPRTRALSPASQPYVATPPATGPRHLVFSRDGQYLFLLTELSAEIKTYRWNQTSGRLTLLHSTPIDPPDFTGARSAAEIRISSDGRFLYVSNRTKSSISVYAVHPGGAVAKVQEISSGGDTPRSFAIDPAGKWLIVGNQLSHTLTMFRINRFSGRLTPVGQPVPVDVKPVAFAFYPGGH